MSPNAIETTTLPLEIENDPPDHVDPVVLNISYTVYTATELYLELQEAIEAGVIDPENPPAPITQEYVNALEDAIQCWQAISERDDYDEFLRDVETLGREELAEVRGTIAYIAPHFGLEVELPAPDERGGDR